MRKIIYLATVLALSLVFGLLSGCSQSVPTGMTVSSPKEYSIDVASKEGIGDYLVDGEGMALYCSTGGLSASAGSANSTLKEWPLFEISSFAPNRSLNASAFTSMVGPQGKAQTFYWGYPLHYSVLDRAPGDTLGDGVDGKWFIAKVPFYSIMLRTGEGVGTYLVDGRGVTLYYNINEGAGKSILPDSEVSEFGFIYYEPYINVPSALQAADFETITRPNGDKQTTFRGWPLYIPIDYSIYQTFNLEPDSPWSIVIPSEMPRN